MCSSASWKEATTMAANMTLQTNAAEHVALQPVHHRALLSGMSNMMRKELGAWFHTRRWLWLLLLWVGVLNGYLAVVLIRQGKLQDRKSTRLNSSHPSSSYAVFCLKK